MNDNVQDAASSSSIQPASSSIEPSSLRKGEELAELFVLRCTRFCREILEDVSLQEINECLAPLPKLNDGKVKKKFDDEVENTFTYFLNNMVNEKAFLEKLNLLSDLDDQAVNRYPAWRPTETMDANTLYRPYRVQILKEEIQKMESVIHAEEVSVDLLQKKLSTFVSTSNDAKAKIACTEKYLNTIQSNINELETSIQYKLNDIRLSEMNPGHRIG